MVTAVVDAGEGSGVASGTTGAMLGEARVVGVPVARPTEILVGVTEFVSVSDDKLEEPVGVAAGTRDTGAVVGASVGTVEGPDVPVRAMRAKVEESWLYIVLVLSWPKPRCTF